MKGCFASGRGFWPRCPGRGSRSWRLRKGAGTRCARSSRKGGVQLDRIEFVDRCGRLDYLRRYREIDICLDTFPSNGHTTSLDALWMGVPVVTLAGETVVGRAGVCQAMNLGLPELIATTPSTTFGSPARSPRTSIIWASFAERCAIA